MSTLDDSSELPEGSNFHAALRGKESPQQIARLYGAAGWSVRVSGWNEFEVTSEVAELVIEGTPVIVHGTVLRPLDNVDRVVAPLAERGIEHFCECYAPDGTLLFERVSSREEG